MKNICNENCFKEIDVKFIEKILKELPSNIFFKDTEARYVFATHYWNHLVMDERESEWSIRGKTDFDIRKDQKNARKAYESDMEILRTGVSQKYILEEKDENGLPQYLEMIKNPVYDDDNKIIGIIGLINDVTERVNLEKKLKYYANCDQLTGLYNRSYLNRWIQEENNSDLYPLAIIFADCNELKRINDTYGHTVGDEYIIKTASLFKLLPKKCLSFRFGGDEFVGIIPRTNQEELEELYKKIKPKSENIKVLNEDLQVAVGSIIVNEYKKDLLKYIDKADAEMYKNKIIMKQNKE